MGQTSWTIKQCLDWTVGYLRDKGEARPQLAAEWLLCAAASLKSRTDLYMNFNRVLQPSELDAMHRAVVRRSHGEPLQYITGETQFRMIQVKCAPGVLIPRPETEVLVDEVLKYLDAQVLSERARAQLSWNAEVEASAQAAREDMPAVTEVEYDLDEDALAQAGDSNEVFGAAAYEPGEDLVEGQAAPAEEAEADEAHVRAKVLEVGCGTGCVSLSLAYERAGQLSCLGTDIEPRAVELATQNRDDLKLSEEDARFIRTNLVSAVPRGEWGSFDVLVSNPPYIPSAVMHELPKEVVDFEPSLALDGGSDGLDIYRRLLKAAPYMLKDGGLFICELFEGACEPAAELCRQAGLEQVEVVEDLTHRPRIVRAIKPANMELAPL